VIIKDTAFSKNTIAKTRRFYCFILNTDLHGFNWWTRIVVAAKAVYSNTTELCWFVTAEWICKTDQ